MIDSHYAFLYFSSVHTIVDVGLQYHPLPPHHSGSGRCGYFLPWLSGSTQLSTFAPASASRAQPDIWVVKGTNTGTGTANIENSLGWVYDRNNFPTALSNQNLPMKPFPQYFVGRTSHVANYRLPLQPLVNTVNYGTFYVRNKQLPDQYWYIKPRAVQVL
jgi:hypothetical protein